MTSTQRMRRGWSKNITKIADGCRCLKEGEGGVQTDMSGRADTKNQHIYIYVIYGSFPLFESRRTIVCESVEEISIKRVKEAKNRRVCRSSAKRPILQKTSRWW